MRTIPFITTAFLVLLVGGCTAQPDGGVPTALVPTAAAQAPTNLPAPVTAPEIENLSLTPIAPPAVPATPTVELISTPLAGEIAVATDVEALIDVASIRLRTGPGLSYDPGQIVRANERYQVLGMSSSGVWFQLDTPDGAGWIPARYMVLVGDGDLVPVVADDLGLALPLGKTPMPRMTNTPIAVAAPSATPRPSASSGNTGAPSAPTSAPAPRSAPPTRVPTPVVQPTSPPAVPTEGYTPIAPTVVPHAPTQ